MTLIRSEYQLNDRIHEDEFAYIYQAVSLKTHTQWLIWEYKSRWMTPNVVHDLILSAQRMIEIHHPNILRLADYHIENDHFFAIYPHENGMRPIEEVLKNQSVGMNVQWGWIQQIILASKELEDNHLVHGNINFETIWLDSHYNIRMTSAGLNAQIIKHHIPKIHSLEDGIMVAPETIQWGEITPRSDMFSVATIMHVLFYQEWPYPYTDKLNKLQKQWSEGKISYDIPSHLPEKVADAIDIALEILPSRRFKTWTEWINMLNHPAELSRIKEKNKLTQESYKMGGYSSRKRPVVGMIPRVFAIMLGLGIIGLTIATIQLSDKSKKSNSNVVVPNVVGMSLKMAQKTLEDAKLEGIVSVTLYHYNIPEGHVIESKPKEGMMVKENRTIKLIISKGKGDVTVSDITGRDIRTATDIMKKIGLNIIVAEEVFSYDYPKGTIISQDTTPNATVSERSDIHVKVSKGIPIDVQIGNVTMRFSRGISKKQREVIVTFDLVEGASAQTVIVNQVTKTETKPIFQKQFKSQGANTFSTYADTGTDIQILFNDDIAYKAKIPEDDTKEAE